MSALELVLRCLGIALLVLLFLVVLLLACPAWVEVAYANGKLTAAARVLGLKMQLYPPRPGKNAKDRGAKGQQKALFPKKGKAGKVPGEKDAQHKAVAEKTAGERPSTGTNPPGDATEEDKARFALGKAVFLAKTAGGAAGRLLHHLRVDRICLRLPIHGRDAAATALRFGRANAWLGAGYATLRNFLRLEVEKIELVPEFDESRREKLSFSCRFGLSPVVLLTVGLDAYRRLRAEDIL